MPKRSKIELAGLTAETLRRAERGDSSTKVRAWLKTQGVEVGLNTVKSFVCHRHGGTWQPARTKKARAQAKAEQLIATPIVEVVKPQPDDCPEVTEIREIAMDRVARGVATPGDARVLEVALKAAIAERMIKSGSV